MTITKSCHLLFLCITIPLVFSDVGVLQGEGPSTQIQRSLHEDRNGSITVSDTPEHAQHSSRKSWLLRGSCTKRDISISQSQGSTTGIPEYIVQIVNTCVSRCAPRDIHLHCGWFASATVINPKLFKRLSYDDCLVNGGKPLAPNQIISFSYYNTFMYPLVLKSAKFC